MEINKIYNENCFDTMDNMFRENQKVDCIITSPPYCTPNDDARKYNDSRFDNYQVHYDVFEGFKGPDDYRAWSISLFNAYDKVLEKNGVILYNISYTAKHTDLVYLVISDIINNTNFTVVDCISWKKKSALPANQDGNRLTRICEFVFVFVRKSELCTFKTNKEPSGNKYKNLFFNFIEAANNDILDLRVNRLNSACFSTDLVMQLLRIYCKHGDLVYDSFMGTGTTALACKRFGCNFIGSELSNAQVQFANDRLLGVNMFRKSNSKKLF